MSKVPRLQREFDEALALATPSQKEALETLRLRLDAIGDEQLDLIDERSAIIATIHRRNQQKGTK